MPHRNVSPIDTESPIEDVLQRDAARQRAGMTKLYYQILSYGKRPLYIPPGVLLHDNKPSEPDRKAADPSEPEVKK